MVEGISTYDEFSCQPFLFQPRGDRGVGSLGSLQDPHRHLSPCDGGGQSETLVPRQQVSLPSIREKIIVFFKIGNTVWFLRKSCLNAASADSRVYIGQQRSLNREISGLFMTIGCPLCLGKVCISAFM